MTESFVKAKLLAKHTDLYHYTTYAFQNVDNREYILCTRFPNWEHESITIGTIGILEFREVLAGKDSWYDGCEFIPYNYTGWHFIKFVPIREEQEDLIINS